MKYSKVNLQNQQQIDNSRLLNIDNLDNKYKELKSNSRLLEIEQNLAGKSSSKYLDEEFSDIARSPSAYPFPSLLDELPFLRDIQPANPNGFERNQDYQNLNLSNHNEDVFLELSETEEIEAINLIQNLLLGGKKTQVASPPPTKTSLSPSADFLIAQPHRTYLENLSGEDDKAIHMLQDILVVPELEELRNFKIAVEQKLGIVESQVNNPAIMNKIEDLESLLQDASLRLTAFGDEQSNIPMAISKVAIALPR